MPSEADIGRLENGNSNLPKSRIDSFELAASWTGTRKEDEKKML